MATLSQVIELVFEGVDNASDTAKQVSSSLKEFGNVATDIAQPLADIANKILLVDSALTALAIVIGVQAVQASAKLETSLSDLSKFLSEGEGDASAYRQQFENLAVTYGANVNEIVQSTADWRAANFDVNQSLALTKSALDFSIAGQISAAESTDLLKKIVAGLSIEQDKAVEASQRFGDVINFVADQSSGSFKELAIAVAGVAPSINQTGASFEQIVGILASINDITQSGAQSFTAFNNIVAQLSKPTKDAETALKDFGIATNAAGVNQSTFFETLTKIAAKWPDLTDKQKAAYAQSIVSAAQVNEFSAILNNWGKSTEYAAGAVNNATGSIASETGRSLATSEQAFKSFSVAIDVAFAGLGDKIKPGAVAITKSLGDLILEFGNLAKLDKSPFEPLFNAFSGFSNDLSRILDAISLNLDDALGQVDFSGLSRALSDLFSELGNLFTAFTGDIDLTTVEGLAEALQKIVDVGEILVRSTQGIAIAFKPFFESVGRAVDEFNRLDSASQLDFGKFIGSAKLLIDAGIGLGSALILIGQTGLDMKEVMEFAFGAVKIAVNSLQVTFDLVALGFLKIIEKATEADIYISKLFGDEAKTAELEKSLTNIRDKIDEFGKAADRNAQELKAGYGLAIGETTDKTESFRQKLITGGEALKNLGDTAQQSGEAARESVKDYDGILAKLNQITPAADTLADSFVKVQSAYSLAQNIQIDVTGIKNATDANNELVVSYSQIGGGTVKATGAFKAVGDSASASAKQIDETTKSANDFKIKMEELASNERIKTIEAAIKFNIAGLEADTKKVEAAFKSIDNTISSTGDLLGSLFGNLEGASTFNRLELIEQIEFERNLREKAFELQKNLVNAQINMMQARTNALARGDAMIKIDGTGLKPQLEAFMWEILKAIQVRANAEFAEFLLGLPTATA